MRTAAETTSFFIEYPYKGETQLAEVRTCCEEDDAFYYDVLLNNQYLFTITQVDDAFGNETWRLALKNADTPVDPELIQIIGKHINLHLV